MKHKIVKLLADQGFLERILQFKNQIKKNKFYPILEPFIYPKSYYKASQASTSFDKEIVFLLSSMRSGSTLLKALLAEADNISNLPEIYFYKYVSSSLFFNLIKDNNIDNSEILLLKHPSQYHDYKSYPILPNVNGKIIILYRNPVDSIVSLHKMNVAVGIEKSQEELIKYWYKTYFNLYKIYKNRDYNCFLVSYEDLVQKPEFITRKIFEFIGINDVLGVKGYSKPKNYSWEWGSDDGGETIDSLKVKNNKRKHGIEYDELIKAIKSNVMIKDIQFLYKEKCHRD